MSDRPGIAPRPLDAGLRGLCPRCGAPGLFAGIVSFAHRCAACGLDFDAFNVGDGPAAILTLVVGAIVAAAAIAVELAFSPPWWVHAILWLPVSLLLILGSLRVCKGMLAALEYKNAAHEGRISGRR